MSISAIVGLFALIVTANLEVFLTEQLGFFRPYFVYVPFVLVAIFAFGSRLELSSYHLYSIRLLWWFLAGVVLTVFSLAVFNPPLGIETHFKSTTWTATLSVCFILLCSDLPQRNAAIRGVLGGVLILAVSCFIEAATSYQFWDDNLGGRLSGLHRNPNTTGLILVLGYFVGQFAIVKHNRRLSLMILIGLAVFLTLSRSAILLFFVSVATSYWCGAYGRMHALVLAYSSITATALLAFLAMGGAGTVATAIGLDLDPYTTNKLTTSFLTSEEASAAERRKQVQQAVDVFGDNETLGIGAFQSVKSNQYDLGPHNMYLRVAVEYGVVGLVWMATLLLCITPNRYCWSFVGLYLASMVFNHTSFDYAVYAVLVPLGACLMYSQQLVELPRVGRRPKPSKLERIKTKRSLLHRLRQPSETRVQMKRRLKQHMHTIQQLNEVFYARVR